MMISLAIYSWSSDSQHEIFQEIHHHHISISPSQSKIVVECSGVSPDLGESGGYTIRRTVYRDPCLQTNPANIPHHKILLRPHAN
jgi:hypothetical protein